jgi:hypothetical protein
MMSSESANLRAWPLLALPGLLGLLIYWPTVHYGFVFDDLSLIGEDGPIRHGTTWLAYRPLRHLSYLLDYHIGGGAAWAYHLSNVIIHGCNAVLISVLARRLGAGIGPAVLGGMLFVSHPLAVEASAYVAGRRDLLALFFSLLSVLAWISARERPSRAALALVAVLAAAMAKESGLGAIGLCVAATVCGLGPRSVVVLVPLLLVTGLSISAVLVYGAVGPLWVSTDPAAAVRIAGALSSHYAISALLPVNLGIDYPHLVCSGASCANLGGPHSRFGIALLVASMAVAAILIRRIGGMTLQARSLTFSSISAVILFSTVCLSIGGHEPGVDRHAYPMLAFVCTTVALICHAAGAGLGSSVSRRVALTLGLILVVAGMRLSEARMKVWESPWTLWGTAVAQSQVSARSHHNMGRLLASEGYYRHARRHLRDALAADREFFPAVVALAAIECERGHYRRATNAFDRARALGATETDLASVQQACEMQRTAS